MAIEPAAAIIITSQVVVAVAVEAVEAVEVDRMYSECRRVPERAWPRPAARP